MCQTLKYLFISTVILFATVTIVFSQANRDIRRTNLKDAAYRDAVKYLKEDWGEDADWAIESNIADFSIKTAFGDLNGDNVEESAVWANYNMGGSGSINRVLIYELDGELSSFVTTVNFGDRAQGGVKSISIAGGQLLIESYLPNEDNCMACYASKTATTKYLLRNGELVDVGRVLNSKTPRTRVTRSKRKKNR